jgi:uncharacterized protein
MSLPQNVTPADAATPGATAQSAGAPPGSAAAARAPILDALRGFAILGILLANIQHFSGWYFLTDAMKAGLANPEMNRAAEFAVAWFIDGKFYSIFSLLFGIGFTVMLNNAATSGRDFHGYYRRRLGILLAIGIVHGWFIWFGDILTLYALLGFLLLRLDAKSDTALLQIAGLCFMLPPLQYVLMYALFGGPAEAGAGNLGQDAFLADIVRRFATGSWLETTTLNLGGVFVGRYPDLLFTGRPFKVLGTFLIGMWIGRRLLWTDLDGHAPLLRSVARWGLTVGLPLNFALALLMRTGEFSRLEPWGLVQSFVYAAGVPALALGYCAAFALLWRAALPRRTLAVFAPAGRMALTNYITQSVVGTALFYGWGGALFGTMGLATALGVAGLIFGTQLLLCAAWLAAFSNGPLEWAWRCLTLRRFQPLLRRRRPSTGDAWSPPP